MTKYYEPWSLSEVSRGTDPNVALIRYDVISEFGTVANLQVFAGDGEGEKYARIMCAAPELLESARDLLEYLEEFWPDEEYFGDDEDTASEPVLALRKAIAKADGDE